MGSNMAQDSKVAIELRKKANNADGIADSYEGQRQEKWFRGFAEVMRTGAREIELLELEKELLKKALADAVAARSAGGAQGHAAKYAGQSWPWVALQRTFGRRRPDRLCPCVQDGARRHRVEAKGLFVSFGPLARLAQDEERRCTGCEALRGRGVGPPLTVPTRQHPREADLLTSACGPAIAYSRVDTGRNPSAVPSSSKLPASHLDSELGLAA